VDKILTDTNDLGLSGKGMNPNAAKLYMEYLCSPEGQKLVADLGEVVLSPGVYPPIKDADKITANSSFMDNPRRMNIKSSAPSSGRSFWGSREMMTQHNALNFSETGGLS
jgi:hypothetical protein